MAKATTAARKAPEDAPVHSTMHETNDALAHFDDAIHEQYAEDWAPPGHLDAPEPRSGYVQRWIRTDLAGKADGKNVAGASRAGWMPRVLTSIPTGERKRYQAVRSARFGDVIKSGDLILCEMPQERFAQMQAYYKRQAEGQVQALVGDHIAKENQSSAGEDGFGPIRMNRKTKVSVRTPIVAADD